MRARNDRICSSDGFIFDSVVWVVGDKNVGVTVVVVLGGEGKIGWSFVGTNNFSTTLLTSSSVSSLGGWVVEITFWFWTAIFFLNKWSNIASSSGLAAAKMGAILPLLPFLIPSLQKENGMWETITLSKGNSIYSFFLLWSIIFVCQFKTFVSLWRKISLTQQKEFWHWRKVERYWVVWISHYDPWKRMGGMFPTTTPILL